MVVHRLVTAAFALAGLVVVVIVGVDGDAWLVSAAATAALLGGIAASGPFAPDRVFAPLNAVASGSVILGVIAVALDLAPTNGKAAFVTAILGAGLAAGVGRIGRADWSGTAWVALGLAYTLGVLALTGWLQGTKATEDEARLAAGGAELGLDILVLSLLYRFRALTKAEEEARKEGKVHAEGLGAHVWVQVLGIGTAGLLSLIALLATAAPLTGIDDLVGGEPQAFDQILRAGLVAVAVALGALGAALVFRAPRQDHPRLHDPIRVSWPALLLVIVSSSLWGVAAIQGLGAELHHVVIAALFAVVVAALTIEDLVNTVVRLQLARMTLRGWLVAGVAGFASGVTMFWLLTTGLWDGELPATTGDAVLAAVTVIVASALIAGLAGTVLTPALPGPPLTAEPPALNMVLGQTLYGMLAFFFMVTPMFIVSRISDVGLANSGLVAAGAAGMLPAIVTGFLIVLGNNSRHAAIEGKHADLPRNIDRYKLGKAQDPHREETNRTALLLSHVKWQNGVARFTVACAAIWALWELV